MSSLLPDYRVYCIHLISWFSFPHRGFRSLYRRVAFFWTLLSPSGFWVEMQPADVGLILTGKRGIRLQRQLKLRSRRAADFPEQLPDPLKNTLPSGTCEPLIRTHRTSAGNEPPPPSPPSAARFVWELHPSVLVLCEQRLFLGGGGWEMEVKRKKKGGINMFYLFLLETCKHSVGLSKNFRTLEVSAWFWISLKSSK